MPWQPLSSLAFLFSLLLLLCLISPNPSLSLLRTDLEVLIQWGLLFAPSSTFHPSPSDGCAELTRSHALARKPVSSALLQFGLLFHPPQPPYASAACHSQFPLWFARKPASAVFCSPSIHLFSFSSSSSRLALPQKLGCSCSWDLLTWAHWYSKKPDTEEKPLEGDSGHW